jgi:hypothetical protein
LIFKPNYPKTILPKKIPIVVFEYRGQLVAFPVSLIATAARKREKK